jgi:N-acylneuraminate cytidylyltransferase
MLEPLNFNRRSQDLQEAWHDAGQFYWGKAQAWLDQKPLFTEDSVPVVLPRHAAQDIDTMEDWKMVEMLFMAKHIKLSGQQADHTKITR